MRDAAILLAGASAGVCLLLALVNGTRLRWERSEYGWFSQVALLSVAYLLVAFRAVLAGWDHADPLAVTALAPVIPLAAWRMSFTFRRPPGGSGD